MAVYVDPIVKWPQEAKLGARRYFGSGKPSCHLVCDGNLEELHQFASSIGLKRAWFQQDGRNQRFWHYDLTPTKRCQAVFAGAIEVGSIHHVPWNGRSHMAIPNP